jgi:mannose/fructose-specific phosphotransferase system component IIA
MIHGVVYTHADLGAAFCRAVESMMGPQRGFVGLSNEGLSGDSMFTAIEEAVGKSVDGAVIFTALYGGSCWQAAERLSRERPEVHHLTGVNLPMLLAFLNKRESTRLDELPEVLAEYGCRGIKP